MFYIYKKQKKLTNGQNKNKLTIGQFLYNRKVLLSYYKNAYGATLHTNFIT